jgi:hypothetical protein
MKITVCVVVVDAFTSTDGGEIVTVSVQVTETVAIAKIVDEVTIVDVESVDIIFSPWVM